jgi:S-adenosylmethionine synthetase
MMNITEIPDDNFFFASESVTEGHPDKLCDSLSDSILDACLAQDPNSFVALEAACKGNMVLLAGEITTNAKVDYKQVALDRIKEVGFDDESKGLDYKTCEVLLYIQTQSKEIAQSVHENKDDEEMGAGDQGHMFGYASAETKELMPFSHLMCLKLSERLTECRKKGIIKWLRPDGKTQVTVQYKKEKDGNVVPLRFHNILISTQHDPGVSNEQIYKEIEEEVVRKVCPSDKIDSNTKIIINPSGSFVLGGPGADAGLTGRKIIVDTYGGWGAHGGGAFSGKDSSKVDRSAAYAARWIAKSLVAAGLCKRALVQIAYSIGIADPLSVHVDTYGTVKEGYTEKDLFNIVCKNFDLKPGAIIKSLDLKKPIFKSTSAYGHFGREEYGFKWEIPKTLNF